MSAIKIPKENVSGGASQIQDVNGLQSALDGKENVANRKTDLTSNSNDYYPTVKAVKTAIDNAGGGGGFQYSTSEAVNTGNKWIDGKDIWVQVVNFGSLPKGDKDIPVEKKVNVPSGIVSVVDTFVDIRGIMPTATSLHPLPYVWSESASTKTSISLRLLNLDSTPNIAIRTAFDYSSTTALIFLYFTKTS